ncbi:unnamed protein product [Linum trigynum]|uniref:Uncharacterized protein n=1 Tax=Linum trigynum TaxID=586398 RepID=A0AAV2E7G0_9ROSI
MPEPPSRLPDESRTPLAYPPSSEGDGVVGQRDGSPRLVLFIADSRREDWGRQLGMWYGETGISFSFKLLPLRC